MNVPREDIFPFSACCDRRRGSVLVGLLWCLALLSIVVIGVLHTARMDLIVGKNHADRIQAHYLALAGIEKAKALLHQDARDRSRSRTHHNGNLYNAPDQFREVKLGRGTYSVLRRGRDDEGGGVLYGVGDEDSRLNVNTVPAEVLSKLQGMTPDVVAAIADWRDSDNSATAGGAESEYYLSLQPPSLPRNGPLQSLRELLMVRGVSPALLFGADSSHNQLLESDFENGESAFVTPAASESDLGWSALLTTQSRNANINAAGEQRVNAQTADQAALEQVSGITSDIARAIVSYRGQNQLQNLADLLEVRAGGAQSSGGARGGQQTSTGATGRTVINEQLLMEIADDVTVDENETQTGLININTAPLEVLAALPGLDRQLAQAIVSYRQSSGFFPNIAWLLKAPGITTAVFKEVAPHVTVRSETFRILAEGRIPSSGARQRILAVVHVGLNDLTTLSWREDDL